MDTGISIGTTSWTEKTLIESGRFYPAEVKTPADRLRFYASQFPIVEVDSSYYALPSERNTVLWTQRTPERFIFDIKAFRLLTQHQTPPSALPRDIRDQLGKIDKPNIYYRDIPDELIAEIWTRFRSAIEPLRAAGKLGVILFQFPPWFVCRSESFQHILQCAERLERIPIAIEFRNKSWLNERHRQDVLAFEREHGLVHVVVDEPQGFSSSIPTVWAATSSEVSVLRLHGRNRESWQKKGLTAAQRFNYRYSEDELRTFVASVRDLATRARSVHVLFNNCYRDHAQVNAAQLQRIVH